MKKALFGAAAALSLVIGGGAAQAAETLTASFATPDGGVTTQQYSGLVNVTVSGIGQSDGLIFNDAFYLLSRDAGADKNYYQLTFGTSTLVASNPAQNAVNFLVEPKPTQSATNTYTFTLDTRTSTPSFLHFGVGDGQFQDNSGSFRITVAAVPEPASWAMMILGMGAVGYAMRRKVRTNEIKFDAKIKRISEGATA